MPTVEEIAAAISGCGTLDEVVAACQQHGWAAVADDGPLWFVCASPLPTKTTPTARRSPTC